MNPVRAQLFPLLKEVSRSFYLTLRVLPKPVRVPIGTAYLLARTSDTIADTDLIPASERLDALSAFYQRVRGDSSVPLRFEKLQPHQSSPAEAFLLKNAEDILALLHDFSQEDRAQIQSVLKTIIDGQKSDIQRFAPASASNIIPLPAADDLNLYTYQVAGCVGEFWTQLCRRHLFPSHPLLNEPQFINDAVRFGKGLQLVNVLRDLPRDLRQGRCYLPAQDLQSVMLAPADLLNPQNEAQLRPVFSKWLAEARECLKEGWRYTNTLPHGQYRLRLACAWPLLIAHDTLFKLDEENPLDPRNRIKISRAQVRSRMLESLCKAPTRSAWQRLLPLPP